MKLSFFPFRAQRAVDASPGPRPGSDAVAAEEDAALNTSAISAMNAERLGLVNALHQLLRGLSQENGDRKSLQRVCEVILAATPKLRLVWVGFCHGDVGAAIEPMAVM